MGIKKYYTVNGAVYGEEDFGAGVFREYIRDAEGSVDGTFDSAGRKNGEYRYKPFGGSLSTSGISAPQRFQWNGGHGYAQTGRAYSDVYVRARHYSTSLKRWSSLDSPLPFKPSYIYCLSSPLTFIDPSGHHSLSYNFGFGIMGIVGELGIGAGGTLDLNDLLNSGPDFNFVEGRGLGVGVNTGHGFSYSQGQPIPGASQSSDFSLYFPELAPGVPVGSVTLPSKPNPQCKTDPSLIQFNGLGYGTPNPGVGGFFETIHTYHFSIRDLVIEGLTHPILSLFSSANSLIK